MYGYTYIHTHIHIVYVYVHVLYSHMQTKSMYHGMDLLGMDLLGIQYRFICQIYMSILCSSSFL